MHDAPLSLTETFEFTRYNGATPLPLGKLIDVVHTPGHLQTVQTIDALTDELQEVVQDVKEKSLISSPYRFREVLALASMKEEGILESTWTTSHSYKHVNGTDLYRILTSHPVLDHIDAGDIPEELIHIHTHPSAEYRPADKQHNHILVSKQDLTAYQNIASFLSHYAGENMNVRGIVAPVGTNCGNVVSEMIIGPSPMNERNPQWTRRAEELRSFRQAQRDFGMDL